MGYIPMIILNTVRTPTRHPAVPGKGCPAYQRLPAYQICQFQRVQECQLCISVVLSCAVTFW